MGRGKNVHGEDHVVYGELFAVGEGKVVTKLEIVNYLIAILADGEIRGTIVLIIRAVVRNGSTFDALFDHGAGTVARKKSDVRHALNVLIVSRFRKEGGELLVEVGIANYERLRFGSGNFGGLAGFRGRFVTGLVAGSEYAKAHYERNNQRDNLFQVFHWNQSPLKFFIISVLTEITRYYVLP